MIRLAHTRRYEHLPSPTHTVYKHRCQMMNWYSQVLVLSVNDQHDCSASTLTPQTPSGHTTARRGDAVPYKEARTRCRRRSTHWCNYTKPWDAVQLVALAKDSRNFPAIENREELMNLAGERVNLQRITRKLTHRRDIISFVDMMHS